MRKRRDALRLVLFVIGILFQFASFFISRVEQLPCVLKVINPTYVRAMSGVNTLESGKPLTSEDVGFREISRMVIKWLDEERLVEARNSAFVMGFEPLQGARIGVGSKTISDPLFRFFLSDNRDFQAATGRLRTNLENSQKKRVFYLALSLLIAGVIIVQVPLFFVRPAPRTVHGPEIKGSK